jgi:hypothetical protein
MADPITYRVYHSPGTGRYAVSLYRGGQRVAELGRNWGWPTYDEAVLAALDWMRDREGVS